MAKSPRLSFTGYRFSEALYRNIDAIKALVAVVGTYTTYLTATGFDWKAFLIAGGLALSALVFKLGADAVDYYFKEVEY